MTTLVRRLLKTVLFIVLFCLFSLLDASHLYTNPLISNDTAIKVAHWLSSDPAPEDIYAVYDYVVIGVNLIAAIVGYILVLKFVLSLEKRRENNRIYQSLFMSDCFCRFNPSHAVSLGINIMLTV